MKRHGLFFSILVLSAGLSSCTLDDRYSSDKIVIDDTSMTFFENGIDIPVGGTEPITVADAIEFIKEQNTEVAEYIIKDPHGNLALGAIGTYSLNEQLKELKLNDLLKINGYSTQQSFDYTLEGFNPENLKIEAQSYSYQANLPATDLESLQMPYVSADPMSITAGFSRFNISSEQRNLASKIGSFSISYPLLSPGDFKNYLVFIQPGTSFTVSQEMLSELKLDEPLNHEITGSITVPGADLISNISNIKLSQGAKMVVELSFEDCFFTSGSAVSALKLDCGSLFSITGSDAQGVVNTDGVNLSADNSWKSTATFDITELNPGAFSFQNGSLNFLGNISIDGGFKVSNLALTKETLENASNDLKINVSVRFENLSLADLDITLDDYSYYGEPQSVNLPVDFTVDLPSELSAINSVSLSPNGPLVLQISASNLDSLKTTDGQGHLSLIPEIEFTFPEGIEVEGAVYNKLSFSADLADGPVTHNISIRKIESNVTQSGKAGFKGTISATAKAKAGGSFSLSNIPMSSGKDISVNVNAGGQLILEDFDAVLNTDALSVSLHEQQDFSFDIPAELGNLGNVTIKPSGSPVFELAINLPENLSELDLLADNIVITLPQMLVFENQSNTISINGAIPPSVTLALKEITFSTDAPVNGKITVDGKIYAKAKKGSITRATIDEISGASIGFALNIPELKAQEISLDKDYVLQISEKIPFSLSAQDIPAELKGIEKVLLDNVNLTVMLELPENMPDLGSQYDIEVNAVLPDYVSPSTISISGTLKKGEVFKRVIPIVGLSRIDLSKGEDISGEIDFNGRLTVQDPSVNFEDINFNTLNGKLTAILGDGDSVENPGFIGIERAEVRVEYNIDEEQAFEINGLSAFRNEDNLITLNPEIKLALTSNLGIPAGGSLSLVPYVGQTQMTDYIVNIDNVSLPYSEDCDSQVTKTYYICKDKSLCPDPSYICIEQNISKVVSCFPDKIVLTLHAGISGEDVIIVQPCDYNCTLDYEVYVPLSFGTGPDGKASELNLSYDFDLEGISSLPSLDVAFQLKADIISTLPIGFDLELAMYDSEGILIPFNSDEDGENTLRIKLDPCDGTTPVLSHIEPVLKFEDTGILSTLSRLSANLHIVTTPDVPIKESDYVQLKNISIGLPEGITYDFFKKEEDTDNEK